MYVQAQSISQLQAVATRVSGSTPVRSQSSASPPASAPADTASAVRDAVTAINRAAKSLNNSIQLSLDDRSGRAIVRVVDSETGQLIRQIPTEEVLDLRRALDKIAGLLINRTA